MTTVDEPGRRGRVTDPRLDQRLKHNRDKRRPTDVPGATQPEYIPDHHRSLIGQPDTSYDRLQRENGLVKLDNEVLRDLLEVAWTTITTLAPTGRNRAADAFRARVWAHLHDEEAACPNCDHYIVNHEAAGPCAVADCDCQGNAA